jgi:hypothetical protein
MLEKANQELEVPLHLASRFSFYLGHFDFHV